MGAERALERTARVGYSRGMPYEDPIEGALRSLTGVEWIKRKTTFEARINKTHLVGIQLELEDHGIASSSEVSAARSGRYIMTVDADQVPKILRAMEVTGAEVKPHRRKRQS